MTYITYSAYSIYIYIYIYTHTYHIYIYARHYVQYQNCTRTHNHHIPYRTVPYRRTTARHGTPSSWRPEWRTLHGIFTGRILYGAQNDNISTLYMARHGTRSSWHPEWCSQNNNKIIINTSYMTISLQLLSTGRILLGAQNGVREGDGPLAQRGVLPGSPWLLLLPVLVFMIIIIIIITYHYHYYICHHYYHHYYC